MAIHIELNNSTGLVGPLLVASPFVNDAPFHQTVILLLSNGPRGATGVMIDRELHQSLCEAGTEQATTTGPVKLLTWQAGQLQKELDSGVWMAGAAPMPVVTQDYAGLWQRVMREVGVSVLRDILGTDIPAEAHRLN